MLILVRTMSLPSSPSSPSFEIDLFPNYLKGVNDARKRLDVKVAKALFKESGKTVPAAFIDIDDDSDTDECTKKRIKISSKNDSLCGPAKINDESFVMISDSEELDVSVVDQSLSEVPSTSCRKSNVRVTRSKAKRGRGRSGRGRRGARNQSSGLGETSGEIIVIDDLEDSRALNSNDIISVVDDDDDDDDDDMEVITRGQDAVLEDSFNISDLEKSSNEIPCDDNYLISVKILWRAIDLIIVPVRRYQKFGVVFKHLAEARKVPEDEIVLILHEKIFIHPDDTPDSLKVTIGDIIEGGIVSKEDVKKKPQEKHTVVAEDSLEFKLLFKDRKKPLIISIKKTDKMSVLMIKCSEELEVPLSTLKFMFDGEELESGATPADLDLEGGEVIEVIRTQ